MNEWLVLLGAFAVIVAIICLVFYAIRQARKNAEPNMGPVVARGADAAGMPDDEHNGTGGVLATLRRFAATNDFEVIAPVSIEGERGQADLDAVLVGWFGVLGVKCLGYEGTVYGNGADAEWTQVNKGSRRTFANPLRVAQQNVRVLRERALQQGLRSLPVECIVVFTGKKTQLAMPRTLPYQTSKTLSSFLNSAHFAEDNKVDTQKAAAAFRA